MFARQASTIIEANTARLARSPSGSTLLPGTKHAKPALNRFWLDIDVPKSRNLVNDPIEKNADGEEDHRGECRHRHSFEFEGSLHHEC